MGAQCANTFDYSQQARKDDLKVLVFDGARIEPEVFAHNRPNRLEVLLRWHLKTAIRDVDLAYAFENVACRRDSLSRALINVRQGSRELLIDRW